MHIVMNVRIIDLMKNYEKKNTFFRQFFKLSFEIIAYMRKFRVLNSYNVQFYTQN